MPIKPQLKTCKNGHPFRKSSDCPVCPICEKLHRPASEFLSQLSRPAQRALKNNGITSLQILSNYDQREILQLHGIGKTTIPKLLSSLTQAGLAFKKNANFILLFFLCQIGSMHSSAQPPKHWNIASIYKPKENPILSADSTFIFKNPIDGKKVAWQKAEVFNPATIVKNDEIIMFFRAEDNPKATLGRRTSRIGMATSKDGYHFKKYSKPVLFPDKDAFLKYDSVGGCEDPRVVQAPTGEYVMAYTAWDGKTARLSIAITKNLKKWKKTGPAFAKAYDAKYLNLWSKSGSMITKFENGKAVLAKINGKYWMYWGEAFINLAYSENLSDWYPLEDVDGNLKQLVKTRPGFFDSSLTECGPPAIWTDKGISLLYNGRNAENESASPDYPRATYTVGQVIFDPNDLEKVIERTDKPFMKPTLPHETTGQYQAGTTFAEGLVFFKNKWWLYYGTADSYVGLAIMDVQK